MRFKRGAAGARAIPTLIAAIVWLTACGGGTPDKLLASAQARIEKADLEAARLELKTLLQAQPQSAQGRFLLGTVQQDLGDAASAEAELRRALELGHPEEQVLPVLAAAMVSQAKGALLLQQYGQVSLSDAQADAEFKTQLAGAEAANGNFEAGMERVAQALSRASDFTPALLLRAKLAQARGDAPDAMAQVQALIDRQPALADAWQLKGELLLRAPSAKPGSARSEAMAAFQESIRLKPDNASAHAEVITAYLLLGDAAAASTQWDAMHKVLPRHPLTMFHQAVLAGHKGDFKRVRELCQLLLRATPNDPRLLLLAGQAELQLQALAQAEAFFGKAAQLAPKSAAPRRWLARVQMRSGQPDKALALLRPLAEAQPPDLRALMQLGQIQLQQGDSRGAEASFARLAKQGPADSRARTGLAWAQLQQGKDDAAFDALLSIARSDSGTVADLALVSARLARNDLAGALRAVQALATKQPDQPLPDHLRGRIALQLKDRAGARKAFEQALTKDADYMPALAGLAMLDVAASQPAAASARFEALLARQPQHTGAMMALAEISARSTHQLDEAVKWLDRAIKSDPANPAPRLVLIDQLMGTRQIKQAISVAQAAVAALPEHGDLLDRLGRLQLMTGDHEQAVSSFNKLAGLWPKSAMPQLRLADVHAAAGNLQAMASAVRKASEIEPASLQVLQARATLSMREGKLDQALGAARQLQARMPEEAMGYRLEGEVELRRQQFDAAATALRKAVAKRQPGDSLLRLHTALALGGKNADAEKLVADHRQRHPDDLAMDMYLGDLAMAGGELATAERHYLRVLERQPQSAVTLNNLAYALARQKRPGATAMAERALALAPDSPALMGTLAYCLAAEQQLPRAIEVQSKAVAAAPRAPQFRLQLARLYLQAGDKSNARSELEKLASLGNQFAGQSEVAALIRTADQ